MECLTITHEDRCLRAAACMYVAAIAELHAWHWLVLSSLSLNQMSNRCSTNSNDVFAFAVDRNFFFVSLWRMASRKFIFRVPTCKGKTKFTAITAWCLYNHGKYYGGDFFFFFFFFFISFIIFFSGAAFKVSGAIRPSPFAPVYFQGWFLTTGAKLFYHSLSIGKIHKFFILYYECTKSFC